MTLEVVGGERLKDCKNTIVFANHPTYVDVTVLMSLMPEVTCVVKKVPWCHPFFGIAKGAGYVSNGEPEALVDDCVAALDRGQSLLLFPEGTRTRPGKPLKFLRGAAYIVLKSGKPILPVLLHCDPPTMTKGSRWFQIPSRAFHFRVEVLPPLHVTDLLQDTSSLAPAIAARRLTEALENYFCLELEKHGKPEARN